MTTAAVHRYNRPTGPPEPCPRTGGPPPLEVIQRRRLAVVRVLLSVVLVVAAAQIALRVLP